MHCPYCSCEDTRVLDSRLGDGGESVRRRRECQECSERFTTYEHAVFQMPHVIKSDGRRENFEESKLRSGLSRALEKRPVNSESVEGAVNRIMQTLIRTGEREVSGKQIGEIVMQQLRQLDEIAYVRFASVYRRFQDIDAFSEEVKKLRDSLSVENQKTQHSILPSDTEET